MGNFATLGSVPKSHPMLAELDRAFCMEPTGLEWSMAQEQDNFIDPVHLTKEGYRAWGREMFDRYNITKRS